MINKLKKWWLGEEVFNNHPLVFSGRGQFKKHWTSSLAHFFISLFINPERRSIFLAVMVFITFIFMLLNHFSNTNTSENTGNPERKSGEKVAEITSQINKDQDSNIENGTKKN